MKLSRVVCLTGWSAAAVLGAYALKAHRRAADLESDYHLSEVCLDGVREDCAELRQRNEDLNAALKTGSEKYSDLAKRFKTADAETKRLGAVVDKAGTELFREGVPGAMLREVGLDYVPAKADGSNMEGLFQAAVGLDASGRPKEQRLLTSTSKRDAAIIQRLRDALTTSVEGVTNWLRPGPEQTLLLEYLNTRAKKGSWYELFPSGVVPPAIKTITGDDPLPELGRMSDASTLSRAEAAAIHAQLPNQTGKRIEGGRPGKPAGFA